MSWSREDDLPQKIAAFQSQSPRLEQAVLQRLTPSLSFDDGDPDLPALPSKRDCLNLRQLLQAIKCRQQNDEITAQDFQETGMKIALSRLLEHGGQLNLRIIYGEVWQGAMIPSQHRTHCVREPLVWMLYRHDFPAWCEDQSTWFEIPTLLRQAIGSDETNFCLALSYYLTYLLYVSGVDSFSSLQEFWQLFYKELCVSFSPIGLHRHGALCQCGMGLALFDILMDRHDSNADYNAWLTPMEICQFLKPFYEPLAKAFGIAQGPHALQALICEKLFTGREFYAKQCLLDACCSQVMQHWSPESVLDRLKADLKKDDNGSDGQSLQAQVSHPAYPVSLYMNIELERNQVSRMALFACQLEEIKGKIVANLVRTCWDLIFDHLLRQRHTPLLYNRGQWPALPQTQALLFTVGCFCSSDSGMLYFCRHLAHFRDYCLEHDNVNAGEKESLNLGLNQTLLSLLHAKYRVDICLHYFAQLQTKHAAFGLALPAEGLPAHQQRQWIAQYLSRDNDVPPRLADHWISFVDAITQQEGGAAALPATATAAALPVTAATEDRPRKKRKLRSRKALERERLEQERLAALQEQEDVEDEDEGPQLKAPPPQAAPSEDDEVIDLADSSSDEDVARRRHSDDEESGGDDGGQGGAGLASRSDDEHKRGRRHLRASSNYAEEEVDTEEHEPRRKRLLGLRASSSFEEGKYEVDTEEEEATPPRRPGRRRKQEVLVDTEDDDEGKDDMASAREQRYASTDDDDEFDEDDAKDGKPSAQKQTIAIDTTENDNDEVDGDRDNDGQYFMDATEDLDDDAGGPRDKSKSPSPERGSPERSPVSSPERQYEQSPVSSPERQSLHSPARRRRSPSPEQQKDVSMDVDDDEREVEEAPQEQQQQQRKLIRQQDSFESAADSAVVLEDVDDDEAEQQRPPPTIRQQDPFDVGGGDAKKRSQDDAAMGEEGRDGTMAEAINDDEEKKNAVVVDDAGDEIASPPHDKAEDLEHEGQQETLSEVAMDEEEQNDAAMDEEGRDGTMAEAINDDEEKKNAVVVDDAGDEIASPPHDKAEDLEHEGQQETLSEVAMDEEEQIPSTAVQQDWNESASAGEAQMNTADDDDKEKQLDNDTKLEAAQDEDPVGVTVADEPEQELGDAELEDGRDDEKEETARAVIEDEQQGDAPAVEATAVDDDEDEPQEAAGESAAAAAAAVDEDQQPADDQPPTGDQAAEVVDDDADGVDKLEAEPIHDGMAADEPQQGEDVDENQRAAATGDDEGVDVPPDAVGAYETRHAGVVDENQRDAKADDEVKAENQAGDVMAADAPQDGEDSAVVDEENQRDVKADNDEVEPPPPGAMEVGDDEAVPVRHVEIPKQPGVVDEEESRPGSPSADVAPEPPAVADQAEAATDRAAPEETAAETPVVDADVEQQAEQCIDSGRDEARTEKLPAAEPTCAEPTADVEMRDALAPTAALLPAEEDSAEALPGEPPSQEPADEDMPEDDFPALHRGEATKPKPAVAATVVESEPTCAMEVDDSKAEETGAATLLQQSAPLVRSTLQATSQSVAASAADAMKEIYSAPAAKPKEEDEQIKVESREEAALQPDADDDDDRKPRARSNPQQPSSTGPEEESTVASQQLPRNDFSAANARMREDRGYDAEESQGHTEDEDDRPEDTTTGAPAAPPPPLAAVAPQPDSNATTIALVVPEQVPRASDQVDPGYDADSREHTEDEAKPTQSKKSRVEEGYEGGESQAHTEDEVSEEETGQPVGIASAPQSASANDLPSVTAPEDRTTAKGTTLSDMSAADERTTGGEEDEVGAELETSEREEAAESGYTQFPANDSGAAQSPVLLVAGSSLMDFAAAAQTQSEEQQRASATPISLRRGVSMARTEMALDGDASRSGSIESGADDEEDGVTNALLVDHVPDATSETNNQGDTKPAAVEEAIDEEEEDRKMPAAARADEAPVEQQDETADPDAPDDGENEKTEADQGGEESISNQAAVAGLAPIPEETPVEFENDASAEQKTKKAPDLPFEPIGRRLRRRGSEPCSEDAGAAPTPTRGRRRRPETAQSTDGGNGGHSKDDGTETPKTRKSKRSSAKAATGEDDDASVASASSRRSTRGTRKRSSAAGDSVSTKASRKSSRSAVEEVETADEAAAASPSPPRKATRRSARGRGDDDSASCSPAVSVAGEDDANDEPSAAEGRKSTRKGRKKRDDDEGSVSSKRSTRSSTRHTAKRKRGDDPEDAAVDDNVEDSAPPSAVSPAVKKSSVAKKVAGKARKKAKPEPPPRVTRSRSGAASAACDTFSVASGTSRGTRTSRQAASTTDSIASRTRRRKISQEEVDTGSVASASQIANDGESVASGRASRKRPANIPPTSITVETTTTPTKKQKRAHSKTDAETKPAAAAEAPPSVESTTRRTRARARPPATRAATSIARRTRRGGRRPGKQKAEENDEEAPTEESGAVAEPNRPPASHQKSNDMEDTS